MPACAGMTMKLYANRKNWPLEGWRVTVARLPGEDSHVSRRLHKTIALTGPLDAEQRARLVEIADKCPVHRMLSGEVSITSDLEAGA